MKLFCFEMPAKGTVRAEIEAMTEEEARALLTAEFSDWEFLDEVCHDPDTENAVLTATIEIE